MPHRGLSWSIVFDMLKRPHNLNLKHTFLYLSSIKVCNLQLQLNTPSLEIEDAFKIFKYILLILAILIFKICCLKGKHLNVSTNKHLRTSTTISEE